MNKAFQAICVPEHVPGQFTPMLNSRQGTQTPPARNGQEEKAIQLLTFEQESVDML